MLGGLIPGSEPDYLAHDIVPVLGSLAEIDAWTNGRAPSGRTLPAILHVDTGMSRLGLDARELAVLQQDHARLDGIALRYVMTHLVASEVAGRSAERAPAPTLRRRLRGSAAGAAQLRQFLRHLPGPRLGFRPGAPGCGALRHQPDPRRANPMRLPVRLRARVLAVRECRQATASAITPLGARHAPSRIATAAIGYADGLHRSLSNRGRGFFDGTPVPLVGRVSMDLTTFDVTEAPGVVPGAWLELIGPAQTPDDLAAAAGTNGYEVLTSLGRRFHRIYQAA